MKRPDADRFVNVIDLEATCWADAAPEGQTNEIIEIGLCVVDVTSRLRVERDRIMVRPTLSEVSEFCTTLTGITPEEAASEVGFAEACALLVERHQARSRRWASWGAYDRKQFERQCAAEDIAYPFPPRHINAKAVFAEVHDRRPMGMARALNYAGLPLEGRHHNGADDAYNTAALVLHLMDAGAWPGVRALRRSS